jgi:hypothetical protein
MLSVAVAGIGPRQKAKNNTERRLAARRCGGLPLGAGDAVSDAREGGPPMGDARRPQGHVQGVCSRGHGAQMACVLPIRHKHALIKKEF